MRYVDGHEQFDPAPSGTYAWSVELAVYDEGEGTSYEQSARIRSSVDFVIP